MTTFDDGPAAGQTLMLQRSPIFLRVTELIGAFDALDQLEDEPEPGETLHAYVLTEKPGFMHIRATKGGGRFSCGKYRLCNPQPTRETMLNTRLWRAWTNSQEQPAFSLR